jgi:hypothetical protein
MVTTVTLSIGLFSAGLGVFGLSAVLIPRFASRFPRLGEFGLLYTLSAAILFIPLRTQVADGFNIIQSWVYGAPVISDTASLEPKLMLPFLEPADDQQVILTISSDPSGARLYIAGDFYGRTPGWLIAPAGKELNYTVIAPDKTVRSFSGWYLAWQDTPLHIWLDRVEP